MEAYSKLRAQLPPVLPYSDLALADGDVIVLAAGFEDRRMAAAERVRHFGGARFVLIRYLPFSEANDEVAISRALEAKGIDPVSGGTIPYHRFEPNCFPETLAKSLRACGARRVILDISAMSRLLVMLCLEVCGEVDCELVVFYAEARTYAPSLEEYKNAKRSLEKHRPSIQLYTGVHGLIRHSRFSSVAMQGQPSAAIAFMSFNEQLTQSLVNEVCPSRLFLINGRPPKHNWREEATAWIHEQLRREWPDNDNPLGRDGIPSRVTSTLDYRETVLLLEELYWQVCAQHRVLIAPTGSKMQVVGVYISKAMHADIHIEYPTPKGFLETYSSGVGACWLVTFGRLGAHVKEWRVLQRVANLAIDGE